MICLTIILIIISSIRITYYDMSLYDYSLSLIINGSIHLIIYILSKIKNFKFKKEELFIFLLMILSCLSLINCYDLKTCLMGRIDRYEGLFVILTYYLLLLNSLNVKGKKEKYIIVSLIILYGLLNTFYGMFQVNLLKTKFDIKNIFYYARGFVGNSMFFSSLISLCYPLILGFCLKEEKIKKLLFFYILLIILTIGVIISGSMSLYVGVILIYLVIIFDTIIHFKKDKILS